MKKVILFLTFIFSCGFIEGQITFFKTITGIDESSSYIEQTTDGGYVIVGMSLSLTDRNGYVIKTNALGDTIWTKIYETQTRLKSGMQTSDGGYVLIGTKLNIPTSNNDIYVLKIDAAGMIQWQKIISQGSGTSIKQTSDGGYILTGAGSLTGTGNGDIYVVKLDALGNLQWNKVIGGPDSEYGSSIQETNDGGYIITGETIDSISSEAYLLKLNNIGNFQWAKTFGGSLYNESSEIIQTTDNGFIISGSRTNVSGTSSDFSIIKTDSLGNMSWAKVYNGASGGPSSIKKTNDGNYIISSAKNAYGQIKMLFTLIDSSGTELWSRFMSPYYPTSMGHYSTGTYAQQTTDGGYVFTGYATTVALQGFIYFIKADSLGKSGCDSTTTLVVNSFTPITNIVSPSIISGIIITNSSYPSSCRSDSIHTYCTSVGINELPSTPQISVYPNPSSGQFNFSGLEKESKIEMFDMTGKIIFQSIGTRDFEMINISDKATGIYFYRITKEMRLVQSGKISLH
jgi:hypothetical protein